MSMPKFPTDACDLTKDNVINQILSSIAMEELGLSHVLNTEGEKMQYLLGTLRGTKKPVKPLDPPTVDEVLAANKSIQKLLDTIMYQQLFLAEKMEEALAVEVDSPLMPKISIGTNGNWLVNGTDTGQSAIGEIYVGTNGNWYINHVDTNVAAKGATGNAGADGTAPSITIGTNGNWFIDGVDTGQSSVYKIENLLAISSTGTWVINGNDTGIAVMSMLSVDSEGYWAINGVSTTTQATGEVGDAGEQGPEGLAGVTGATGAEGVVPTVGINSSGYWEIDGTATAVQAQGPPGPGALVPFASGLPTDITLVLGGLAGIPEFIGFGSSFPGVSVLGSTITFTGGTLTNYAFVVPRDGEITDIAASFMITAGLALDMTPTFYIYSAPLGSAAFSLLSSTTLTLPSLTGISIGETVYGSVNNLAVSVSVGEQLLLIAAATSSDPLASGTIAGYISAGMQIVYS